MRPSGEVSCFGAALLLAPLGCVPWMATVNSLKLSPSHNRSSCQIWSHNITKVGDIRSGVDSSTVHLLITCVQGQEEYLESETSHSDETS